MRKCGDACMGIKEDVMTEYKKEAPKEDYSGCGTHSQHLETIQTIEDHLAEILKLVTELKNSAVTEWGHSIADYTEEFDEIIDRVRKAWDLVPDEEPSMQKMVDALKEEYGDVKDLYKNEKP